VLTEAEYDRRASKAHEDRLRRRASRKGLRLKKHRTRRPRAFEYGRFLIVAPEINGVVAGSPWRLSLDDVETELASLAERGWTEDRARQYRGN
jgi:hypothetical protein